MQSWFQKVKPVSIKLYGVIKWNEGIVKDKKRKKKTGRKRTYKEREKDEKESKKERKKIRREKNEKKGRKEKSIEWKKRARSNESNRNRFGQDNWISIEGRLANVSKHFALSRLVEDAP